MKRLSLILVLALLTTLTGGCRFSIVEDDAIVARLSAARAEGMDLFSIESPDFSYFDEDEPVDFEPTPAPTPTGDVPPTPEPTAEPIPEITPIPTPMPRVKVTPTPEPRPEVIGLDSRDEEGETAVRRIQERLVELGYLSSEPDGVFGSRTLKALRRFQEDKGLEETGVYDDPTRLAMFPPPKVTTAPEDVLYAEGSSGTDVRVVRRMLRQYGFSARPAGTVFDAETADEVMNFQQYAVSCLGTEYDEPVDTTPAYLMEETGLVESALTPTGEILTPTPSPSPSPVPQTMDLMVTEMPILIPEATLRPDHALDGVVSKKLYDYLTSNRFPVYRCTVQRGDTGAEVERVQRRLTVLDYFYDDINGEFGEATFQALRTYQKRSGLQETGIADEETQQLLFSGSAIAAEQVEKPFYIKVSLREQRVYVYRWFEGGYNQLIKTMICSSGLGNSTPRGVFVSPGHRDTRWHYFAEFHCWAQYAFVITGNILFHSVIYSSPDEGAVRTSTVHALGHKASHGCVRLRVADARWIYEHCGSGQVIEVY